MTQIYMFELTNAVNNEMYTAWHKIYCINTALVLQAAKMHKICLHIKCTHADVCKHSNIAINL